LLAAAYCIRLYTLNSLTTGDGRPVEELKVAIDQLLVEYLLSRQLDEAAQCVKELNCPHFHHEIVKRAVQQAIDKSEQDCTAMSSLLAYLHTSEVISSAQVSVGFDRLWEAVTDLSLDMPHAPELLEKFTQQAIQVYYVSSYHFNHVAH
jgi:programmed cell death protein 4